LIGLTDLPARSFEGKERLNMLVKCDGICQRPTEAEK